MRRGDEHLRLERGVQVGTVHGYRASAAAGGKWRNLLLGAFASSARTRFLPLWRSERKPSVFPPPPPLSEGALSLSLPEPLVFHHFLLAPFSAAGGEHECRVRVTVSDVGEERVWQEAMDDGERLG